MAARALFQFCPLCVLQDVEDVPPVVKEETGDAARCFAFGAPSANERAPRRIRGTNGEGRQQDLSTPAHRIVDRACSACDAWEIDRVSAYLRRFTHFARLAHLVGVNGRGPVDPGDAFPVVGEGGGNAGGSNAEAFGIGIPESRTCSACTTVVLEPRSSWLKKLDSTCPSPITAIFTRGASGRDGPGAGHANGLKVRLLRNKAGRWG